MNISKKRLLFNPNVHITFSLGRMVKDEFLMAGGKDDL